LRFKSGAANNFADGPEYAFRTQRGRGSTYNFAVQADSHMGARTRFQKWCGPRCERETSDDAAFATTMANIVARTPDFLVDLGDTTMTSQNQQNGLFEIQNRERGAPITEHEAIADYVYLRNLLSQAGSSVPVYLVLGNHDAERGTRLNGTADNLAVWANNARKNYFPTPTANGFYTGSVAEVEYIGRHDAHFAWEWGDALFVGLDPFWNSFGNTAWDRTLGREQYDWLKETLERSDATFKFVFLHHLVGGLDNPYGSSRGGHIYAEYFEWGGRTPFDYQNWDRDNFTPYEGGSGTDIDGYVARPRVDPETEADDFGKYREGWGVPIHQMLVDNGVTIVFHGHDHLYAKEIHRDGIIYQETPAPSRPAGPGRGDLMLGAAQKGYDLDNGVIIGNSGFLNVSVSPEEVTVEYVKNTEDCAQACGEIADRYTIPAAGR